MKTWKILARHKWVAGATITESYKIDCEEYRSFTATIRGFRNWHIRTDYMKNISTQEIINKVTSIRDRIDADDEGVFLLK